MPKDAAKHPKVHRAAPCPKVYLTPNVRGAAGKKLLHLKRRQCLKWERQERALEAVRQRFAFHLHMCLLRGLEGVPESLWTLPESLEVNKADFEGNCELLELMHIKCQTQCPAHGKYSTNINSSFLPSIENDFSFSPQLSPLAGRFLVCVSCHCWSHFSIP